VFSFRILSVVVLKEKKNFQCNNQIGNFKFLCVFTKLREVSVSFVMSFCPVKLALSAWNNLAPSGQILIKFDI
jgi:hypothetical protein